MMTSWRHAPGRSLHPGSLFDVGLRGEYSFCLRRVAWSDDRPFIGFLFFSRHARWKSSPCCFFLVFFCMGRFLYRRFPLLIADYGVFNPMALFLLFDEKGLSCKKSPQREACSVLSFIHVLAFVLHPGSISVSDPLNSCPWSCFPLDCILFFLSLFFFSTLQAGEGPPDWLCEASLFWVRGSLLGLSMFPSWLQSPLS